MRKVLLATTLLLGSFMGKSQFTQSDLIYYVGEGPDTAVLVIDFLDGTSDTSYAWGYLFDASETTTGEDLLNAVSGDEQTLDVVISGGFLDEITYNAHNGLNGDPNYWGTWSRTADTGWESNMGVGTVLANGDWFGCSYTDFDPAIVPGEPLAAYESAKYDMTLVQFWVGSGTDSAVFVLDFVDAVYGEAVTYAWGYLFDGPTDGATMLAHIDAADVNLDIDAGAFLNDIIFNDLAGIGGDPSYWGTWSGTNLTDWTMNAGLSTEINNGDWFGCSYAEWPPRRPYYPISSLDSAAFTIDDVEFIFGSGENRAVLVLDFNEWYADQSYAFGYYFDTETITAQEVMEALAAEETYGLEFDLTGGFLNDVVYGAAGEEGIGGSPYYWGTWSATNIGGWEMNAGIGEEMSDGDWFACSYTAWSPATPPSLPILGYEYWSIAEENKSPLSIYPNPASTQVSIVLEDNAQIQILDLQGRVVLDANYVKGIHQLDVEGLKSGVYFILAIENDQTIKQKLVVE